MLFDSDLERHFLPGGSSIASFACSFDFDTDLVSSLFQAFLYCDLSGLLIDRDLLIAFDLLIGLGALSFVRELDHLGYRQPLSFLLQFAVLDFCGFAGNLQRVRLQLRDR